MPLPQDGAAREDGRKVRVQAIMLIMSLSVNY